MKAAKLIKKFEGCKLNAYKDPVGVWTIGWGTTGGDIKRGMRITQEQADKMLHDRIEKEFKATVEKYVKVPLSENQKAALISFVYNVGQNAFANSTLLKKLNNSDYIGAANEMIRWNKAKGKVLDGLTYRRVAERDLFLGNVKEHEEGGC